MLVGLEKMIYVKNRENRFFKVLSRITAFYATLMIAILLGLYIIVAYIFRKKEVFFRKLVTKSILLTSGLKTEIKGKEDPEAQMFIINHKSLLDIMIMEAITTKDVLWIAKKELFKMPFYKYILILPRAVSLNRESSKSIIDLLRGVKKGAEENRVTCIFPEGTRNVDPNIEMIEFKKGAEIVANKLNLRVQPVVMVNTEKRLNSSDFRHSFGKVKVIYLDAFNVSKDSGEWLDKTREDMIKVYRENL